MASLAIVIAVAGPLALAAGARAPSADGKAAGCARLQSKVRSLKRTLRTAPGPAKRQLRKKLSDKRRRAKLACAVPPGGGFLEEPLPIGEPAGTLGDDPGGWLGEGGSEFPGGGGPGGPPCIPPANSVLPAQSISSSFRTALKGQLLPEPLTPGAQFDFWFRVGFNQSFQSQNFILRPNTTNTINHFVPQFGTPGNDFYGEPVSGESQVAEYAATVRVPSCTPPGRYFLQWRAIRKSTGEWGGTEPSMVLEVIE